MTSFENYLIELGYLKFILIPKTLKYEATSKHDLSVMTNLDHRYFHKSDKIIEKINAGKTCDEITFEDRDGEIRFGLHEVGKPPTLINPRPRIAITRNGNIMGQQYDDAMNIVLAKFSNEEIYKAMFDRTIILELNLDTNS